MDANINIEEIVKQVLAGMTGQAPAAAAAPHGKRKHSENCSCGNADRTGTF